MARQLDMDFNIVWGKLEEINSTDEVNIANASFVLNWLKKRS